ncbi:hypothetical protein L226DRAFT_542117 [Lentinus tigrinus ALCF2SS1-7]|uniref:DUF6533 domain-containing protein n=1 Tax=Lentinus tigrinus ALCF2SS1-6 TaxID=1328759 RepID=A0A5C2SU97_9APHY|nr:hypothetical protein L227DRAFT_582337 [Lentinus tigrinus ALCF2SS1-6]RPD80817.1 hypothetical protein L226DRAFT_542117 [Lentinus tigrinus ALCF2SS1-7]
MSDSDSELVAIFESSQIGAYFAAASAGLFAYEYAVTFDREVDLFWKRRITVSSILFLINRYVPFVVNMFYAPWPLYPTTYNILEIFQYLPWAVFSALRAYVLTSRGRFIAGFVFLLALVPVVINYVTLGYATPIVDPLFGCFTIISRISLITSDLLLMGVTWLATYKTSRQIKALNQVTSLSSVLFRDGVLMREWELRRTLISQQILNQNDSPNASYITILTEPITAILISRFLIDLQEANVQSMHQHSLESVSTLDFNGVIGSVTFHLPAPGEDPSDITHSQGTSMSCAPDSDPDVQMSARCSHEDTASNTV